MTSLPTRSQGFSGKSMTILAATVPSGFQSWRRCDRRSHGSRCCCNRSCVDVCPNRSASDPDKSAPSFCVGRWIIIPGIKSAVQSKSHRSSPLQSSILHSDCNFCSACTWSTQLSKAQQSCMSTTSEEASRLEAAHPYWSAEYSPWWTTIAQGHKRAMIYSSTRPHDHHPPRGCHLVQPCIGICKQNHLAVMFMENLPTSPVPTLNRLTTNVLP